MCACAYGLNNLSTGACAHIANFVQCACGCGKKRRTLTVCGFSTLSLSSFPAIENSSLLWFDSVLDLFEIISYVNSILTLIKEGSKMEGPLYFDLGGSF